MSQAQLKALEAYLRLKNINGAAQVFRAAEELGVFDALSVGQLEAAGVATACEAQAGPMELLLDALCASGALERYGDDFALAPAIRLMPGDERDLGDRYWRHLAQFVRSGESLASPALDVQKEWGIEPYRSRAVASQWMMTPAAMSVAKALDIGTVRKNLSILDLGAGSGVFGLTLAYSDPGGSLTVVDWPAALTGATETARGIGLEGRFTMIEGDYRQVPLPEAKFDLALVANITHLGSAPENLALFRRVHAALKPTGEVAIIDVFPGQPAGDVTRTLFELSLALRTESGRVLRPDDLQAMLMEAGFEKPTFAQLPVPPNTLGLMVATKL